MAPWALALTVATSSPLACAFEHPPSVSARAFADMDATLTISSALPRPEAAPYPARLAGWRRAEFHAPLHRRWRLGLEHGRRSVQLVCPRPKAAEADPVSAGGRPVPRPARDIDAVPKALYWRAGQLQNEAASARETGRGTAPGRNPEHLEMLADEFRALAKSIEAHVRKDGGR